MPDAPLSAATSPTTTAAAPSSAVTGFKAINSGGFTAVNRTPKPDAPVASATATAKNTPDMKASTLAPASSLKRQLSNESFDSGTKDGGETDDGDLGRRSKRFKKGGSRLYSGC
jgi:histone demethylase JARID1